MDFNGVIIDDEKIQMSAYQQILAGENITLTEDDYYSCLGMDDRSFVRSAYERQGKKCEASKVLEIVQAKTEKWREVIAGQVPLFEGVENFVRKMAKEFALGIVSMAKREEIEFVLETSGLIESFSIMVSAEDVSNCKPDPECYRKGFERLDLFRIESSHLPMTHSECLVIEDTPAGVLAGKSAGLPVLGVTNTVSKAELHDAGANWVAKDLNDWMPESVKLAFA